MSKNTFVALLAALINVASCVLCAFFTNGLRCVADSSAQLGLIRDAIESDYGWVVGESSLVDADFAQSRKLLLNSEASHQMISQPTFMAFVGIDNSNISLGCEGVDYGATTVINISQVCEPNDSFGYLFALPVTPIFTFDYCDWNRYMHIAEPAYISKDFALRLLDERSGYERIEDLLGSTFDVNYRGTSVEHVIANILDYSNLEGTVLKNRYGNIVVSASKTLFSTSELFINTSFSADILSSRDCAKILSSQRLRKAEFRICKDGKWIKTDASQMYGELCMGNFSSDVANIAFFGVLFCVFEFLFVFVMLTIRTSTKEKIIASLPSFFCMGIISVVNLTSNIVKILSFANQFVSAICLVNVILLGVLFLAETRRTLHGKNNFVIKG